MTAAQIAAVLGVKNIRINYNANENLSDKETFLFKGEEKAWPMQKLEFTKYKGNFKEMIKVYQKTKYFPKDIHFQDTTEDKKKRMATFPEY